MISLICLCKHKDSVLSCSHAVDPPERQTFKQCERSADFYTAVMIVYCCSYKLIFLQKILFNKHV